VHHPDYYRNRGQGVWPTDFDDPIPMPFLVVKPGAKFLLAIDAPSKDWGAFVIELLKWSLRNLGVGGKTSSGYGFMKVE
jgi:CRISPR type III-B/RAMP module RAMP protein Cmr6